MGAHEIAESPVSRIEALLTWLGGGHSRELAERHERSAHAVAGAVVLLGAVLAWAVASVAVSQATAWPVPAVLPLTLVFGLLVGAVTRGTVAAPHRGRRGIAGRAAVAFATGVVVGELAALVLFTGSIDHRLDEAALRNADSTPAVAQAAASLQQTRDARAALDRAVDGAREQQDKALVVARCEYHPTPACPQTRITGDPGAGPETRTANDLLADAQRQLDEALAARDARAPGLDAAMAREQQDLTDARRTAAAQAGRGLGARWVAMNDATTAGAGALSLRLATGAACALLYLLPLILGLWRGQTTHDRRATARAERERAELEAETAIAVKRAEVRREAEIMWAEHQLTQARLAVEAQIEIDREQQRRRVAEALEAPVTASSRREFRPTQPIAPTPPREEPTLEEDIYLPIAAEAEAASRAIAELPAGARDDVHDEPENLPAAIEAADVEPRRDRATPVIPSLPDATKAAARWIRPLVPPLVARVIDNTTAPLRTARQVFEEVEEITFSLKRTRKVTFDAETSEASAPSEASATSMTVEAPASPPPPMGRVPSSRGAAHGEARRATGREYTSMEEISGAGAGRPTLGREGRLELMEREGHRRLDPPDEPRQLPPAK